MSVAKFTSSYITFVYFSGFELPKYNKLNKNNHLFHIRFISDCADGLTRELIDFVHCACFPKPQTFLWSLYVRRTTVIHRVAVT